MSLIRTASSVLIKHFKLFLCFSFVLKKQSWEVRHLSPELSKGWSAWNLQMAQISIVTSFFVVCTRNFLICSIVVGIPILSLVIKCPSNYNLYNMQQFVHFSHLWPEAMTKSPIGDFSVRADDLGDRDRATELLSVAVQLGATCLWIDSQSAARPRHC